jgi:hypothetical protein
VIFPPLQTRDGLIWVSENREQMTKWQQQHLSQIERIIGQQFLRDICPLSDPEQVLCRYSGLNANATGHYPRSSRANSLSG